jgi:hypothetical protein
LNTDEEAQAGSWNVKQAPIINHTRSRSIVFGTRAKFLARRRKWGRSVRKKITGKRRRRTGRYMKDRPMKEKKQSGELLRCVMCHFKTSVPIKLSLHYSTHPGNNYIF